MDDTTEELQTISSCAACKIRKRKCSKKCLLAPYFPKNSPESFLTTTKLFKANKIAKIIKDTKPELRADAVNSMTYEASVRKWDPVNGCFGVIKRMEMEVSELKYRLAIAKEELNALQKPFLADSVPKVEVKQELNALQKPLIADSIPKAEVKQELNALQKPFIADSVPKVEVKQELNALQKPLIVDSAPNVEATETIMDLIRNTPEEIDVQMDDILMEEDNAFQSPNWEELLRLDLEELSK